MTKITFVNGTTPAVNATNLNQMQTNIENAINALNPVVLYNNTNGATGTVTLSETAANFQYLEILYSKGGIYQSVKVYSPNNKKVSLLVGYLNSSSEAQLQLAKVTISGTQITRDTGGYINFYENAHYMGTGTEVGIHRVLGYR